MISTMPRVCFSDRCDCLTFDTPIVRIGQSHLALKATPKLNTYLFREMSGEVFEWETITVTDEDVSGARSDADMPQHGHRFDSRISRAGDQHEASARVPEWFVLIRSRCLSQFAGSRLAPALVEQTFLSRRIGLKGKKYIYIYVIQPSYRDIFFLQQVRRIYRILLLKR